MIYYREGYKYQLAEDYEIQTPIKATLKHDYFTLSCRDKEPA